MNNHRACSGVGTCNDRGHCACPEGTTGVDCAEGLPARLDQTCPDLRRRLARERAAVDYFDAVDLGDEDDGDAGLSVGLYTGGCHRGDGPPGCPTLWGKCRKGEVKSPRVFVYTLPGPMVWNDTSDVDFGRPTSIMFLERLLASEHRTADPEEADYFFIPMVGGVSIETGRGRTGNRLHGIRYVKNHPVYRKYWSAKGGADHFAIGADDSGAGRYFMGEAGVDRQNYPEAMKMIFLSHMGLHDGWDRTGYKGAFVPGQDIVVPPLQPHAQVVGMLSESPLMRGSRTWDGSAGVEGAGRSTLLFFAGSVKPLRPEHDCPPPGEGFSCNVRKAVVEQWSGKTGFHVYDHATPEYHKEMAESHFCLGVGGVGGGWGRRHTLAAMHGCIPVIIMDGASLELEELIPWDKMSVRVAEKDIEKLDTILAEVMANEVRMRNMRAELACAWPRLLWSSIEGSHAGEDGTDDAFTSVMEILRRRLGGRGAGNVIKGAMDGGGASGADDPSNEVPKAVAEEDSSNIPKHRKELYHTTKLGKFGKNYETAKGWHPTKKPKKSSKKKDPAVTKIRRTLLEATDEGAFRVVQPMPSSCTRSSASAAGHGHVPSLCYSFKRKNAEGRYCGPIMNFDTPRGGAVCVGNEYNGTPKGKEGKDWKPRDFPCKVEVREGGGDGSGPVRA